MPSDQSQRATRSVLLIGINDILQGANASTIVGRIDSLRGVLPEVRSVCIFPFGNYVSWTSGKEAIRNEVNTYIRTLPNSIDLESILGDEDDTQPRLLAEYDSGDGLHINHDPGDFVAAQAMYDQGNWI